MISAMEFATIAALAGVDEDTSKRAYNAMDDILQEDDADMPGDEDVEMGSGRKQKKM